MTMNGGISSSGRLAVSFVSSRGGWPPSNGQGALNVSDDRGRRKQGVQRCSEFLATLVPIARIFLSRRRASCPSAGRGTTA